MSSNSVTIFLDSFLMIMAISFIGLRLPLTYLQNADLFNPHLAANLEWIKCLESKYCFNFIKYPKNKVDSVDRDTLT